MTTAVQPEDFDVAKAVFDQLKDLTAERQRRILRWVTEGLGVSITAPSTDPAVEPTTSPAPAPPAPANSADTTSTDIKSFVAAKSPKSDNQFAATVAYYYRFDAPPAEKRDSITAEVLQEATRLVGRSRLGSPRKTLNNAKAAGYLDNPTRGEYTVNSVGENLVAMTLPGGGSDPPPGRRNVKRKAAGKTAAKKKTPKKKTLRGKSKR